MLVNRMTFNTKVGRTGELVELIKSGVDFGLPTPPRAWRVYWPNISPYDVVIAEVEFQSLEEHAVYWEKWRTSPQVGEFLDKMQQLTERGGTDEVWHVEDLT